MIRGEAFSEGAVEVLVSSSGFEKTHYEFDQCPETNWRHKAQWYVVELAGRILMEVR